MEPDWTGWPIGTTEPTSLTTARPARHKRRAELHTKKPRDGAMCRGITRDQSRPSLTESNINMMGRLRLCQ